VADAREEVAGANQARRGSSGAQPSSPRALGTAVAAMRGGDACGMTNVSQVST
jgi:hypothetical protein